MNARIVRASGTLRPRMWSATSRALRGETWTNFAVACTVAGRLDGCHHRFFTCVF